MTADELAEEMQKLEDKYKKGDETYDPEAHKEADD